jgi:SAM-dependent methyltransferase
MSVTSATALRWQVRLFPPDTHPFRIFERTVESVLRPDSVLLDAGCGRTAPLLRKFAPGISRAIGVDVVDFCSGDAAGMELIQSDLSTIPLPDGSVDVIMSRSVMEHLGDPLSVYLEMRRLLRPGGTFIFLTPNLWDYASLIARAVPNALHPTIVARVQGRPEEDTFPTYYRSNTRSSIRRLARASGFEVASCNHLGQYPAYLMFHPVPFLIGAGYEKVISNVPALRPLQAWILCTLRAL